MRYDNPVNIKLYSYENSAFVLKAIIDDYNEISFSHNLYEAGDFTITINYNIPNAYWFRRGWFVQFGNDPYMFGEIQSISDAIGEDGKGSQIRTITGKDARFIFKRRIIRNLNDEDAWTMTAKSELCLRNLINDQCGANAEEKRLLPVVNTIPESADAIGSTYTVSESYTNLYDSLVTIATQSEIGWRIKFNGELTLEVYEGSDLSDHVQFSTDFDSLANGEFKDSSESFANTVYVGGKGTGSDRDIYEGESAIGGESPTGFDRFEAWDNQSGMTEESEYEAEAISMLTQYGQTLQLSGQGLAKCPYIFKEQYNIGDTIKVAFSGKSANVQILSVTEHWSFGQYGIEFAFGKPQNDLSRQLQLILNQIQRASNKNKKTDSIWWYTIPTDTAQKSSEVIYDRIGFQGVCASGGSTFQLYFRAGSNGISPVGAKTYHIYVKQLSGGNLTLTTGVTGKETLTLPSGTYVAIIYVDEEGNIKYQTATPTTSVTSGSSLPVTSGAVASALGWGSHVFIKREFNIAYQSGGTWYDNNVWWRVFEGEFNQVSYSDLYMEITVVNTSYNHRTPSVTKYAVSPQYQNVPSEPLVEIYRRGDSCHGIRVGRSSTNHWYVDLYLYANTYYISAVGQNFKKTTITSKPSTSNFSYMHTLQV